MKCDFRSSTFYTLDHLFQLLPRISNDVSDMAGIRRRGNEIHHILLCILMLMRIPQDHVKKLVQSFYIFLTVLLTLEIEKINDHRIRYFVDIQGTELLLDMISIKRIIFFERRIRGCFKLCVNLLSGVE